MPVAAEIISSPVRHTRLQFGMAFAAMGALTMLSAPQISPASGGIGVDPIDALRHLREERLDCLGVGFGKLGADNDARRHAAAAVIERVPRLGKAHRGAEALAELRGSGGDIGLRQHRNAAVFGLEERNDLARLALPFHGHVGVEIKPVLGEQIPQEIFRACCPCRSRRPFFP